ncbi:MAG: hypothetical protein AB7I01_05530 [Gammaproteobacteria bacterium]
MDMAAQFTEMSAAKFRVFTAGLPSEITDVRRDNVCKQTKIDQLTHEISLLKRHRYGKVAEHMKGEQRQLSDETLAADLEAMTQELKARQSLETEAPPKEMPKRAPLPATLPRQEVRLGPETTECGSGCQLTRIGEDVSEKLTVPELTGVLDEIHHREQGDICKTQAIAGNVIALGDEAIEPSQAALSLALQVVRCMGDAVHTRLEPFAAFA